MNGASAISARRPNAAVWFFALLTVYYGAQTLLRISYAASLTLDEAEMLVVTQEFALGYGASQPPLYGWLLLATFKLFGAGIPALAITKYGMLWLAFALMFLSALLIFRDDLKAALITAALATIPQISWKALFDLTHSIAALTTAAATFYVFLLVLRDGRRRHYLAFGVCVALGLMSKYNYGLFAAALLAAAASMPSLRPRILSPWMLAALGVAVLLLLPHLHWVVTHPDAAMSRVGKLGIADKLSILAAAGPALLTFGRILFNCVALSLAVFALVAFVPYRPTEIPPRAPDEWQDGKTLVVRTLAISFVFVLLLVVASRTTMMRDHWLLPLLLPLPIGLFVLFERRFTPARTKTLGFASAALAAAIMLGITVQHFFPDLAARPPRASAPYGAVADAIRNLGFRQGYILGETHFTAGNLKLRFPESRAGDPEYGLQPRAAFEQARPVLVAWPGANPQPPGSLRALWRSLCGDLPPGLTATPITAPFERSRRSTFQLNVIVQQGCQPRGAISLAPPDRPFPTAVGTAKKLNNNSLIAAFFIKSP